MSEPFKAIRIRHPAEILEEVNKKTIDGTMEDYIRELEMAVAVDPNGYNGCRTAIITIRHELTQQFKELLDATNIYTTTHIKGPYQVSFAHDKSFDDIMVRWPAAIESFMKAHKKPYTDSIKGEIVK